MLSFVYDLEHHVASEAGRKIPPPDRRENRSGGSAANHGDHQVGILPYLFIAD